MLKKLLSFIKDFYGAINNEKGWLCINISVT